MCLKQLISFISCLNPYLEGASVAQAVLEEPILRYRGAWVPQLVFDAGAARAALALAALSSSLALTASHMPLERETWPRPSWEGPSYP